MRRTLLGILTFMLAAAAPSLAADGAKLLDDAFVKAIKANNLGGIAMLYGKDAVLIPPDGPAAKGYDAIQQHYAGLLAKYTVQDFTMADAQYYSAGTLSAGWGTWSMTVVPKAGGAPVTMAGRFSDVARAEKAPDGTWHWFLIVDHASLRSTPGALEPPAAPPAPPAAEPAAPPPTPNP